MKDARASVAGSLSAPRDEVIRIDEGLIKEHLDKVVVQTVEADGSTPCRTPKRTDCAG